MPPRFKIRVKCIETGKIYESIGEASFNENVETYAIRNCLKTGNKYLGKHFVKVEEETNEKTNIQ